MPASVPIRLERGKLVGAGGVVAAPRARGAAARACRSRPRSGPCSSRTSSPPRCGRRAPSAGRCCSGLYERLGHLGVEAGARRTELAAANERLGPLAETTTDSFKVLTGCSRSGPIAATIRSGPSCRASTTRAMRSASSTSKAREHLAKGQGHPAVGPQVAAHLEELAAFLAAASAERPLSRSWIATWNKRAQALISQMIGGQQLGPDLGSAGPGRQSRPSRSRGRRISSSTAW